MKQRYVFTLWTLVLVLFLLSACADEREVVDADRLVPVAKGINLQGSLDLTDTTSSISFSIAVTQPSAIQALSVIVYKQLNEGERIRHAEYTEIPPTLTISLAEMLEGMNLERKEIEGGSVFTLSFFVTTAEGTYTSANKLLVKTFCSSELNDSYLTITEGESGPGGGGKYKDIRALVNVRKLEANAYEISDISGGMFATIWGGDAQPGRIRDNCEKLEILSFTDQWGNIFSGAGEIIGDTLIIEWQSTYGDKGRSVYLTR